MMKGKSKYRRSGQVGKSVGKERRGNDKGGEKWERDKIKKEETTLVRNNQESRHNYWVTRSFVRSSAPTAH